MGENADVVRRAYELADGPEPDGDGFRALFTEDGVFDPMFAEGSFRGEQIKTVVEDLGTQIADVRRELLEVHELGDVVAVELVVRGSFRGPVETPVGSIERAGVPVSVPCADFWYLRDGKISRFNCYLEQSVLLEQVGAWDRVVDPGQDDPGQDDPGQDTRGQHDRGQEA